METETARRRVERIAAHLSATEALVTHVFPLNCSSGLTTIKRRADNSMHFARQDSKSQGSFMRPASTEQGCSGQSSLPLMSTLSHKEESSELVRPLFSQPANINSNPPKVRNLQYAVDDYLLPSLQPPKFSRPTTESDVPTKFIRMNDTFVTKSLALEKKRSPRMDVAESGGRYMLLIELPGISIDDIRVEVDNTSLTIETTKGRATACSFSNHASSAYHRREIVEGPFEIVWPLPLDVNPDSVSAEFLDGLLRVTIPKLRVPVW